MGGAERPAVLILFPMFANIGVMALMLPQVYQPVELVDLALMASVGVGWRLLEACQLMAELVAENQHQWPRKVMTRRQTQNSGARLERRRRLLLHRLAR